MPIRGFDLYSEAPATEKLPIDVLKDNTIAIDGFWYIKKHIPTFNKDGILNFHSALDSALSNLISLSKTTKILWVWDGIDLDLPGSLKENPASKAPFLMRTIDQNKILKTNFIDFELFVDYTSSLLNKHNITVIRAPYLAMAQCAYFLKHNCVKYIYSKTDALMFRDTNRIITDIFYDSNLIQVVDRTQLFKLNGLDLFTFQTLSLLSGCEICPTVPMYAGDFTLEKIFEIIKNNDLEKRLLTSYSTRRNVKVDDINDFAFSTSDEGNYLSLFNRALALLLYHPIITLDGIVKIQDEEDAPNDLESILGKRLPQNIYQDLFKNNISSKILSKLAQKSQFTEPPSNTILKEFSNILENSLDTREIYASQCLKYMLKLDLDFVSGIDKLPQIIFAFLVRFGVKNDRLLNIINMGVKKDNKKTKTIKLEDAEFYLGNIETILLFKELVKLIMLNSSMENDMDLEYTLENFCQDWDTAALKKFVAANKSYELFSTYIK